MGNTGGLEKNDIREDYEAVVSARYLTGANDAEFHEALAAAMKNPARLKEVSLL